MVRRLAWFAPADANCFHLDHRLTPVLLSGRAAATACMRMIALAWLLTSMPALADQPTSFRLMSFNIWMGGVEAGQPLSKTVEVMKLADVVGVQEAFDEETDNSIELARQLDWHLLQQGEHRAIISRYPISGHTPNKFGAFIKLSDQQTICLFNIHLPAAPYQPYQLLDIEYGEAPFIKTEREAIDWASRSRGTELTQMLVELSDVRDRGIPTFVTGDFNEPSYLDWTEGAAKSGVHPIKVGYPTAKLVAAHGMIDTYRQHLPNSLTHPGFTWTPLTETTDTADHHDRIDFVFADRRYCTVKRCDVIGEKEETADVVISPWPSDHRAVMATVSVQVNAH